MTGPNPGVGLDRPHHDGSALYVSTETPRLGDRVTVWLRVPAGATRPGEAPYAAAYVRLLHDGEPRFVAAVRDVEPVSYTHLDVYKRQASRTRLVISSLATPAILSAKPMLSATDMCG